MMFIVGTGREGAGHFQLGGQLSKALPSRWLSLQVCGSGSGPSICSKGIGFCFLCSGFYLGCPQCGGEKYHPHFSSVPRHPES